MFVFGLSEPGRGSDATNPQVTAKKDGNEWVIKGEKCWSTNAKWSSHVVVHAMTDLNLSQVTGLHVSLFQWIIPMFLIKKWQAKICGVNLQQVQFPLMMFAVSDDAIWVKRMKVSR